MKRAQAWFPKRSPNKPDAANPAGASRDNPRFMAAGSQIRGRWAEKTAMKTFPSTKHEWLAFALFPFKTYAVLAFPCYRIFRFFCPKPFLGTSLFDATEFAFITGFMVCANVLLIGAVLQYFVSGWRCAMPTLGFALIQKLVLSYYWWSTYPIIHVMIPSLMVAAAATYLTSLICRKALQEYRILGWRLGLVGAVAAGMGAGLLMLLALRVHPGGFGIYSPGVRPVLFWICITGSIFGILPSELVVRHYQKKLAQANHVAQLGASPNGGPATPLGSSDVAAGPPSVS